MSALLPLLTLFAPSVVIVDEDRFVINPHLRINRSRRKKDNLAQSQPEGRANQPSYMVADNLTDGRLHGSNNGSSES